MSEKRRCSLCGASRMDNGACSLLGCRDPLFDQRAEEAIAAAEERGRRSGLEERDELRATIAELLPMAERAHHADLGKHLCPDISSLPEGLRIAREGALLLRLHHPDLAPRDSAPQHKDWCALFGNPEAGKSCDCAPRDSGKGAPVKELTREEAVAMFGPRKDRP